MVRNGDIGKWTYSNVRLDTTSTDTDDDDSGNITTESSTVLNGNRQGCRPEDHEALRSVLVMSFRVQKDGSDHLQTSR
jgi:hypothetical protein